MRSIVKQIFDELVNEAADFDPKSVHVNRQLPFDEAQLRWLFLTLAHIIERVHTMSESLDQANQRLQADEAATAQEFADLNTVLGTLESNATSQASLITQLQSQLANGASAGDLSATIDQLEKINSDGAAIVKAAQDAAAANNSTPTPVTPATPASPDAPAVAPAAPGVGHARPDVTPPVGHARPGVTPPGPKR